MSQESTESACLEISQMDDQRNIHSRIYEGWVRHRRLSPVLNSFTYRVFMMFIDLSEIPQLFDGRWLWSARRIAPARFKRSDYHGDPTKDIDTAVRDTIENATGSRPNGPIRLLTHLRYFGYIFNPVSLYYCYDESGTSVKTILAEITNTPWKERRAIVLSDDINDGKGNVRRYRFRKDFHVSPFMSMNIDYDWRFSTPKDKCVVHMINMENGKEVFEATLSLSERSITSFNLFTVLIWHPLMTLKVAAAIHWQALKLYFKKATFYPHPKNAGNPDGIHHPGCGLPRPLTSTTPIDKAKLDEKGEELSSEDKV